jgi:flavin reductase (DIM6/NTAB) family NADH-FMN oxidoreductase RutF
VVQFPGVVDLTAVGVGVDTDELRVLFGCFPSGVTALCALADGTPVGMVASTFTAVSLRPPLASVCVQRTSTTWPRLRAAVRLGVSVLGQSHGAVCRRLAAKTGDRFAGIDVTATLGGGLLIDGAAAWMECAVRAELPAGDHVIVLLDIHALRAEPEVPPLVFHASRFRSLMPASAEAVPPT